MELKTFLKRNYPILLIILAGAILRFCCLPCESLWLDEGLTVKWISMDPLSMLTAISHDTQAPMYYLLMIAWVSLSGMSETSLRMPSAIFGILSIPLIYFLGKRLFSERVGLYASLLMAFSSIGLYYSNEARPYSFLIFLSMSSFLFLDMILKKERFGTVLYVLSGILMLYTHIFSVFILVSQIAYILIASGKRPALWKWVAFQGTIILAYLPWISVALMQAGSSGGHGGPLYWIASPGPVSVASTFFDFSSFMYSLSGPESAFYYPVIALASVQALLFVFLGLHSLADFRTRALRPLPDNTRLVLAWLVIPIASVLLASYLVFPVYFTRYLLISLPAFILLVAAGLSNIRNRSLRRGIISLVLILSLVTISWQFAQVNKESWRGVAGYLDEMAHTGDQVFLYPGYSTGGPINYYLERGDLEIIPLEREKVHGSLAIEDFPDTVNERFWLILFDSLGDGEALNQGSLRGATVIEQRSFPGIRAYLFSREII